jgi:hypothetical protein
MLIPKYHTIYIHVRKTGGTSIKGAFGSLLLQPEKHPSLQRMLELYPEAIDFYKFAFVRNPWDWIVSLYEYAKHQRYINLSFDKFIVGLQDRSFYQEKHTLAPRVLIPQLQMLTTDGSADPIKLGIDFIGRFEQLEKHFEVVCKKIGHPHKKLPHLTVTKHPHYRTYYVDNNLRDIVGDLYTVDIDTFGYTF